MSPVVLSTTNTASTAIMRPSTVANTISAPMKSMQGGMMRQTTVFVSAPKLPSVAVMRCPSDPAKLSAVLADHHSIGEPGKRAGWQPTEAKRRSMPTQR